MEDTNSTPDSQAGGEALYLNDGEKKRDARGGKSKNGAEQFRRRRKLSRVIAMQFLFQADVQKCWEETWKELASFRNMVSDVWFDVDEDLEGPSQEDLDGAWAYAELLIKGVMDFHDDLDGLIGKAAMNWTVARMGLIDRSILRLSAFEILKVEKVSPATAINEAVELAKRFGQPDSPRFINGVLDKVRRIVQKTAQTAAAEGKNSWNEGKKEQ